MDDMDGFGVVASVTQLERPTRTTGSLDMRCVGVCEKEIPICYPFGKISLAI